MSEIQLSDGCVARTAPPAVIAEREATYAAWVQNVTKRRPVGHETIQVRARPSHWTALRKPLSDCTVALVTTGGVHLKTQPPFAIFEEVGDWSLRAIPGDVDTAELTVTHSHYATQDALEDVNVMFPLDRLRELAQERVVGKAASLHYGFMGFIPDPRPLLSDTVPGMVAEFRDRAVDVVVLTPG